MEVGSESDTSTALPPGKNPPVPIEQDAGWAPEPVWMLSEKINVLPMPSRTAPRSIELQCESSAELIAVVGFR